MKRILLALLLGTFAFGQEGHPLVGSWHGTWGTSATDRHDITVILFWDGKAITGMVNPGPDTMKLENTTLKPAEGWALHFEGNMKTGSKTDRVIADGKIQNVSNVRRTITGTWMHGPVKGDFTIKRDN